MMMTRAPIVLSAIAILTMPLAALADPPAGGGGDEKPAKQVTAQAKKQPARQFIRVTRDKNQQPKALETLIARYVAAGDKNKDVTVDLVGAVHVGEKSYYDALNRQFDKYDVVLYELVAPKGTEIPKGGTGRSNHPIGVLQRGMKQMLELEFQLDAVDYTKKHFVHADMTPEQFSKSMKDRDESFWSMFVKLWMQGIAQQSRNPQGSSDVELLVALISKDRATKLKRFLAEQMENMGGTMAVLDGPDGSTILTERNKVALKVLQEQIKGGKKRVAIFYGAAHLGDMEKRLLADFGMKHQADRWIAAWDLADKKKAAARPAPPRGEAKPENKPAEKATAP